MKSDKQWLPLILSGSLQPLLFHFFIYFCQPIIWQHWRHIRLFWLFYESTHDDPQQSIGRSSLRLSRTGNWMKCQREMLIRLSSDVIHRLWHPQQLAESWQIQCCIVRLCHKRCTNKGDYFWTSSCIIYFECTLWHKHSLPNTFGLTQTCTSREISMTNMLLIDYHWKGSSDLLRIWRPLVDFSLIWNFWLNVEEWLKAVTRYNTE